MLDATRAFYSQMGKIDVMNWTLIRGQGDTTLFPEPDLSNQFKQRPALTLLTRFYTSMQQLETFRVENYTNFDQLDLVAGYRPYG